MLSDAMGAMFVELDQVQQLARDVVEVLARRVVEVHRSMLLVALVDGPEEPD
jgi:hypothetical protein